MGSGGRPLSRLCPIVRKQAARQGEQAARAYPKRDILRPEGAKASSSQVASYWAYPRATQQACPVRTLVTQLPLNLRWVPPVGVDPTVVSPAAKSDCRPER